MLSIFILKNLTFCLLDRMGDGTRMVSVLVVTWMHQLLFTFLLLCPAAGSCVIPHRAVRYQSLLRRSPAVRTRAKTVEGENPVQKARLHHCDWK